MSRFSAQLTDYVLLDHCGIVTLCCSSAPVRCQLQSELSDKCTLGEEKGVPFLVTELCSRGDLSDVLQDRSISWSQWCVV